MVIVFKAGSGYAEQGLAGDELENKASETPDVQRFVDSPVENQLGGAKTMRSDWLCQWVGEEVC